MDDYQTATNAAFTGNLTMDKLKESMRNMESLLRGVMLPIFPPLRIIESRWLTKRVQVRFSRRNKKRIIKKFQKNPRNYEERPDTSVYLTPHGQICHPIVAAKLLSALKAVAHTVSTGEGEG